MKNIILFHIHAATLAAFVLLPSLASAQATGQTGYDTSFETIARITGDLHHTLDLNQRAGLNTKPILLDKLATPYLQIHESAAPNPVRTVCLSSGFVDLMNFISHAKAIDGWKGGFLNKSMARISTEGSDGKLPDLQANAPRNAWSFTTMNRQASYFNQIAGSLIAIDLAHYSLGHYQRYASQLAGGQNQTASINSVVTPAEWREAVLSGASHGLDCGLDVDGLKTVFESIDKMPSRPPWRICFMPDAVTGKEISKLNRDLDQVQKKAFLSFAK